MNFLKLKRHLDKFLPVYVIVSMILGFYTGLHVNVKKYASTFKILNMVVVISMIYPMMVNLRVEALKKAFKSWEQLLIALTMGLVFAPLLMYGLTVLFNIGNRLSLGLLLAVVVSCSSMSIAYTGFTEGNLKLATIIVAVTFSLAIITVPGWLTLFASQYNIPTPTWLLVKTAIIVVIVPLVLGYATRMAIIKNAGVEKFERIKPLFPSVSLIGMYIIVFLISMEKAILIAKKPGIVVEALFPLLYYGITLILFTFMDKRFGTPYGGPYGDNLYSYWKRRRYSDGNSSSGRYGSYGDTAYHSTTASDTVPYWIR